jgi:hypothetical protein
MVCEGLILTHIMTQIFQKRCKKFDGNALILARHRAKISTGAPILRQTLAMVHVTSCDGEIIPNFQIADEYDQRGLLIHRA